jgi:ADP-ribosylglycohydrolase
MPATAPAVPAARTRQHLHVGARRRRPRHDHGQDQQLEGLWRRDADRTHRPDGRMGRRTRVRGRRGRRGDHPWPSLGVSERRRNGGHGTSAGRWRCVARGGQAGGRAGRHLERQPRNHDGAAEGARSDAHPFGTARRSIRLLGQGWVGEEALAIGLYAAPAGGSVAETLAIAANHDGDSDSTASIAGQLWRAWHGVAGIPHRWVRRIDVIEPIWELTHDLIAANGSMI